MTTFASRELAGWGRYPVQTCRAARPEKRRDLLQAALSSEVPDIVARGLGRSYGDAALNAESGVLLTEKLGRFLDFDQSTGVLHAESGASLDDIVQTFVPRGYFLPVTPGTKFVTLGGCIACDVHGKNHHRDGSFVNFLQEFELLLASGEVITCSRTENPEAFWATVAGYGLTGVILTAKIKLIPIETAYVATTYTRTKNLDQTLVEFRDESATPYTIAWIDCLSTGENLGRSVIMRGEHAKHDELLSGVEPLELVSKKKKAIPRDLPNFVLNPLSVRGFNEFYYAAHPSGKKIVPFGAFFWPLDAVAGWNRIYGSRGFIQYQCVIPQHNARAGLVALLEKVSVAGRAPFLAALKVAGEENEAALGFSKPGFNLALDLPTTEGVVEFAHELDEITLKHEGRCYLTKDATLTPENVRLMYPRLSEWEAVRNQLDPEGRFQSSLSKRLQIGANAGGAA